MYLSMLAIRYPRGIHPASSWANPRRMPGGCQVDGGLELRNKSVCGEEGYGIMTRKKIWSTGFIR